MGTPHFIIIKVRNIEYKLQLDLFLKQFCLWQSARWDGYPSGQGMRVLSFLRRLVEENRWEEFVEKCEQLTRDDQDDDAQEKKQEMKMIEQIIYPYKLQKTFFSILQMGLNYLPYDETHVISKDPIRIFYTSPSNLKMDNDGRMLVPKTLFSRVLDSFDDYRNYIVSHSSECSADILDMILDGRVKSVAFCEPNWPANRDACQWGYLIDCTTKELLVYSDYEHSSDDEDDSNSEERDEDKDEDNDTSNTDTDNKKNDANERKSLGNDPLEFIDPIRLIARFDINNLPSDEEFVKIGY